MEERPKVLCEICYKLPARYVCSYCGKRVCINCYDPYSGMCIECAKRFEARAGIRESQLPPAPVSSGEFSGMTLVMIGFALSFIGAMIMMIASLVGGVKGVSGGAMIFIWPFIPIPIITTWGPLGKFILFIFLIIALALAIFALINVLRKRKNIV